MSPVFIHLHIPRTGGTTLDVEYLANLFSAEDSCRDLAGYGETFIKIKSILINNNVDFITKKQIIQNDLPINKKYYSGHMTFGLHKFIPNKTIYITTIRDPLGRIKSYYKILCGLRKEIISFENFLEEWQEITNGQTRYLSNDGFTSRLSTLSMLKEAKNNLQQHFLYAPMDEMNMLVAFVFDYLKLKDIKYEKIILNDSETGKPIRFSEKLFIDTPKFNKTQIQYLLENNKLDIELYNWTKETYWLNNINMLINIANHISEY